MAYAEAITAVSSLVVGTPVQIRMIASPTGFVRIYDPTLGGTASAASANLPTLTPTKQISQEAQLVLVDTTTAASTTGASTVNGLVQAKIVPAAVDTVNGSSVTAPVSLGQGDILITATG